MRPRLPAPALPLSLALATGCGKPTQPRDVAGTYVLERFGGDPVPATVPYQGMTYTMESSTLTLGRDGRFTLAARAALSALVAGPTPTRASTSSGTYTRDGAVVRFTPTDRAPWTARVDRETLTTDAEPVGVFRRR